MLMLVSIESTMTSTTVTLAREILQCSTLSCITSAVRPRLRMPPTSRDAQ